MAPNPIVSIRQRPTCNNRPERSSQPPSNKFSAFNAIGLTVLVAIFATKPWTRVWIYSGACIESLILIHGALNCTCVLSKLSLPTQLLLLNLTFLLCSTSWLFCFAFSVACYLAIVYTCLVQYQVASVLARQTMRKLFPGTHFFQDKIALFELPALAIDAEVTGLFVVRGITISLLDLTVEAHGIELAIRLNGETELCIYLDELRIHLFESIDISDVYGNLKVGKSEGLFAHEKKGEVAHQPGSQTGRRLVKDTKSFLLSAGANVTVMREQTTEKGQKSVGPSKAKSGGQNSAREDPGKEKYDNYLQHIETTSPVSIAQKQLQDQGSPLQSQDEKEVRQTICAKLRELPSISHIPKHAISVRVLQTIFPRIRRFLHRLPLLMRLVLSPLSYFHPIHMSSISIAGPGDELERLLQEYLPQSEESSADKDQEAQKEISAWLNDADFCLEITDITSLAQVPFGPTGLITIYLRGIDVGLYRTVVEEKKARLVTHVGGTDATFVIPAFLLPHHEHYLPPTPGKVRRNGVESTGSDTQGGIFTLQEEAESEEATLDTTEVIISMHASLPTYFDQSLLDIAAALAKATELVDLENLFERETSDGEPQQESSEPDSTSTEDPDASSDNIRGTRRHSDTNEAGGSPTTKASRTRQYLKDGIKKSLKMNALGDKLNDRWIARTVGKIASRLEEAQGDFGYTVRRQVPLQPYRATAETASKILP